VRVQVRDTFARVLARDPEVRVTTKMEPDGWDFLEVRLRDNTYKLTVGVTEAAAVVYVLKNIQDDGVHQGMFFNFNCPIARMGRLRRTALVLLKKMQHAEVYEVMNA
jgi:hypothetical protein